jgi:hypothetical protein
LVAEFRGLGENAPLWRYLGFMYFEDDTVRTEARAIIARDPDLNEELMEYLDNEILASDAVNYIFDVHAGPPAILAPAYARLLEKKLGRFRELLNPSQRPDARHKFDISRLIGAASRIHQAGGDLTPQLTAWRDYLRTIKEMDATSESIQRTLQQETRP